MSIYIGTFVNYDQVFSGNKGLLVNWKSIAYRKDDGQMGFGIDAQSKMILNCMVDECVWYNATRDTYCQIYTMSNSYNFGLRDIFFYPSEYLLAEVEKEDKMKIVLKKNALLKRYGKPELNVQRTLLTELYNGSSYDNPSIEGLISCGIDILILLFGAEFVYLLTPCNSQFIDKLKETARKLVEEVIVVPTREDFPQH